MILHSAAFYKGPLKLAILDLAGTLLDFGSCAPAGAFVQLFARLGITLTDAEARGPMGMPKHDHIAELCRLKTVRHQWEEMFGKPVTDADVDTLYDGFIPLQIDVLPHYSELIPGALESVSAIRRRGLSIALTTGYNREMMACVLERAAEQGLKGDVALCADDVSVGRPAPWMAQECARRLGIFPPSACIKIGDTLVDVQEGRNAGMWSIGVSISGNMAGMPIEKWKTLDAQQQEAIRQTAAREMFRAGAHAVVDDITECPAVIDTLNARMAAGGEPDSSDGSYI